jgi:hypothetical protein
MPTPLCSKCRAPLMTREAIGKAIVDAMAKADAVAAAPIMDGRADYAGAYGTITGAIKALRHELAGTCAMCGFIADYARKDAA